MSGSLNWRKETKSRAELVSQSDGDETYHLKKEERKYITFSTYPVKGRYYVSVDPFRLQMFAC